MRYSKQSNKVKYWVDCLTSHTSDPQSCQKLCCNFLFPNSGDESTLNQLILQPESLSRVDERGWIPLHEAAVQENKKILEMIFSCTKFLTMSLFFSFFLDANPLLCIWVAASLPGAAQCRTLKGEPPLFLAVVHGIRENATFLLQNGCSPDIQNDEQDSPLVAGTQLPL